MGNRHIVRPLVVAAVITSTLALVGCSQAASNDDVEQACEQVASKGVVSWWIDQGHERPWDVTDEASTGIRKGSESSDEATVFYVDGTAAVHQDEGSSGQKVTWSCFAQYTSDDPSKVYANIREVSEG